MTLARSSATTNSTYDTTLPEPLTTSYPPFGVTLFGTAQCVPGGTGVPFLYAVRRDLVWNTLAINVIPKYQRRCFYTPFGVTLFGTVDEIVMTGSVDDVSIRRSA